ncbi:hypothetical protein Syun_013275 [Stephania yunnanensis]|uniref:protein-serine/threonine phosphatase n=1 Tax=Stephania yunnanensis TaxID=152371 RepID=A0AAP0PJP2_9MAGN
MYDSGRLSLNASTACLLPLLLKIRFFACMGNYLPTCKTWTRLGISLAPLMCQILVFSVICFGLILMVVCRDGDKILEVVEDGFEFFANKQLVTLFSAPNFCGEYANAGVMMSVDEPLMCSFQILKPADMKPKSSCSNTKTATTSSSSAVREKESILASPARARNNASPPTRLLARNNVSPPPTRRGGYKSVPRSIRRRREDVKRESLPPLEGISIQATAVREDDVNKQGEPSLLERNSRNLISSRREKCGTSPMKAVARPKTLARIKHGTSPTKGVNRPVTPARSVAPFGMECIRPRTPPPRSQKPFRKEQKQ